MLLRGEVVISGSCLGVDKLDVFLVLTSHTYPHTHSSEQSREMKYATHIWILFLVSVVKL